MVLRTMYKNLIYFRDFFYLYLKNRYPSYSNETLNKESSIAIIMLLSGYYSTIIASLLLIFFKLNLLPKPNLNNTFLTKIVVAIILFGPLYIIMNFLTSKFTPIPVQEHLVLTHKNEIVKRLIIVFVFGYLSIFLVLSTLNYLLHLI